MRKIYIILLFIISWQVIHAAAQKDTVKTELATSVTLSMFINPKHVPLNRTVRCIVRVSWQGELDLIEVKDIEEPFLTNLEITGSSASNQTYNSKQGSRAVKEVVYILKPLSLGMGYAEGTAVAYKNLMTGRSYNLRTERVGVEITAPVHEPTGLNYLWIWITVAFLLIACAGIALFYFRKKRKAEIAEEPGVNKIIEEKYLKQLKDSFDLQAKDKNESYTVLIRIFRKYLSEKYRISALETTTEELLKILTDEDLDEKLIKKTEQLFLKADIVKFSGHESTQAEIDEAYTAVEMILETHLAREKKKIEKQQKENSKRKKRKLLLCNKESDKG